ncbi:MAG: urease accessory protein UreF [Congregibacter sp.]
MADPRLHLLHLSSPALPVGAYAYSQGLEYAIEAGWLADEKLRDWLRDGLHLGVARLDLPILRRVLEAAREGDTVAMNRWNDELLANRETRELVLEDQQMGQALLRLLKSLHAQLEDGFTQVPAYACAFAVACKVWDIDASDAMRAYCFSWLENQVTAATKLVPLGQTQAQRLLVGLLDEIPDACERGITVADEAIGLSLPGLALASSAHEKQHTRLFRS